MTDCWTYFGWKSQMYSIKLSFSHALLGRKLMGKRFNLIRLSALKIRLLDQDDFCVQIDGENFAYIFQIIWRSKFYPKN